MNGSVKRAGWIAIGTIASAMLVAASIPVDAASKTKTMIRNYGPYDLEAGGLMQMQNEKNYAADEPFWVTSYRTEIIGEDGVRMPDNFHCHTTFRTPVEKPWWAWSQHHKTIDTVPFTGLYSDGHTTRLEIPEGFGVFFDEGDPIRMMPMFNNRSDDVMEATMRATMEYVPASELERPLRPLFSTSISVVYPHLYFVDPGTDKREISFRFSYPGTIHLMAVHVHPYGKVVELFNDSKGESVWKAVGRRNPDGTLIDMPVYTNDEGYPFSPGEDYRLRVTYENPTDRQQDAMGGIFVFFSTEDDELPAPDLQGVEVTDEPAHDHHHH